MIWKRVGIAIFALGAAGFALGGYAYQQDHPQMTETQLFQDGTVPACGVFAAMFVLAACSLWRSAQDDE